MLKLADDLHLVRLSSNYNLSAFNCDDSELNGFLVDDALAYQEQFLTNTTLLIKDNHIASYFSLAADAILLNSEEKTTQEITTPFSSFPALKIARLATDVKYRKQGYGSLAVRYCVGLARHLNDEHRHDGLACRFVTVDAYPNSVDWYKLKFGFVENERHRNRNRETVSLRLDVLPSKDLPANGL